MEVAGYCIYIYPKGDLHLTIQSTTTHSVFLLTSHRYWCYEKQILLQFSHFVVVHFTITSYLTTGIK